MAISRVFKRLWPWGARRTRPTAASLTVPREVLESFQMFTLGELTRGVAHQINQPLTSIRLGAEMLQLRSGNELPEESQRELKAILAGVDRITRVTAQMRSLDLTEPRHCQTLALDTLATAVCQWMRARLSASGIRLQREFPKSLPGIHGQRNELQQVILRLLDNACEAVLSPGVAEPLIVLRLARTRSRLRLSIDDNGPGIAPEKRQQIWRPFQGSKLAAMNSGLGLGICQRIAERHGGRVRLRRSQIGGACFALELPIADTHPVTS